jgi:hypothetical protein
MISLLYVGSGDDEIVEHADWVEASTLFRADGTISQEDLARAINVDRSVPQPKARLLAQDAFEELADRIESCGENAYPKVASYPFELIDGNAVLKKRPADPAHPDAGLLYLFLLFLTRSDMSSTTRKKSVLDPTKVFERLCADVLREFWGGESAHSDCMVFGTAKVAAPAAAAGTKPNAKEKAKGAAKAPSAAKSFPHNINHLCSMLQEGAGWKAGARSPKAGDGKLDAVVYRRFRDKRAGGLVGFAQCKTGIHWREHLTKLHPRGFCGNYMLSPLLIEPFRIYMVPHRIIAERWEADTRAGGLLFDRCRIVQYGNSIKAENLNDCRTWLDEVLAGGTKAP